MLRHKHCIDWGKRGELVSQGETMATEKPSQGCVSAAPATHESVIPNPKLKLMDQIREVMKESISDRRALDLAFFGWIERS